MNQQEENQDFFISKSLLCQPNIKVWNTALSQLRTQHPLEEWNYSINLRLKICVEVTHSQDQLGARTVMNTCQVPWGPPPMSKYLHMKSWNRIYCPSLINQCKGQKSRWCTMIVRTFSWQSSFEDQHSINAELRCSSYTMEHNQEIWQ